MTKENGNNKKENIMTNEEMRVAIAEVLGWMGVEHFSYPSGIHLMGFPPGVVNKPDIIRLGEESGIEMRFDSAVKKLLPNYPEDLNACAEMEKHLTGMERLIYLRALCADATNHNWDSNSPTIDECWHMRHATAKQLCINFLKTVGKWR